LFIIHSTYVQFYKDSYIALNEIEKTISDLDRVMALDSNDYESRSKLSLLRSDLGRSYLSQSTPNPSKALVEFTKAIEAQPSISQNYYLRARAFFMQGDVEAARGDLKESLNLDPGNQEAAALLSELTAGPPMDQLYPFPMQKVKTTKPNRHYIVVEGSGGNKAGLKRAGGGGGGGGAQDGVLGPLLPPLMVNGGSNQVQQKLMVTRSAISTPPVARGMMTSADESWFLSSAAEGNGGGGGLVENDYDGTRQTPTPTSSKAPLVPKIPSVREKLRPKTPHLSVINLG
jgi:hypothetical protein